MSVLHETNSRLIKWVDVEIVALANITICSLDPRDVSTLAPQTEKGN